MVAVSIQMFGESSHSINTGRIHSEYEIVPLQSQQLNIISACLITVSHFHRKAQKGLIQSELSATSLVLLEHPLKTASLQTVLERPVV